MAKKIVILEDNPERREAMLGHLRERFFQFQSQFFDCSAQMIDYLQINWTDIIAIGLDNDLELLPNEDGRLIDPGCGREVADYLAGKTRICPVVIHTTNSDAAVGMERVLREANWTTYRVTPYGDLDWIASDWFPTIRRAIVGPTAKQKKQQKTKASD
jgi:hypothetical protein